MLLAITERILYGAGTTTALVAAAALIATGSALLACTPLVAVTGAALGLMAPWSRR